MFVFRIQVMKGMCKQGYKDALHFLKKNGEKLLFPLLKLSDNDRILLVFQDLPCLLRWSLRRASCSLLAMCKIRINDTFPKMLMHIHIISRLFIYLR